MEVITYTTLSVDGRIGYPGRKTVLSSNRDLYRLHRYRSIVDGVMVGANTVISDNPLLTVRLPGYKGRQPVRIVVDSKLRTPLNANVYNVELAPSMLITSTENRGVEKIKLLERRGVWVIYVSERDGTLDLGEALRILEEEYGVRKILVEGGGYLIGKLIEGKLVDEIHVTISPILLGKGGVPYINLILEKPVRLRLVNYELDGETGEIHLVYRPVYNQY